MAGGEKMNFDEIPFRRQLGYAVTFLCVGYMIFEFTAYMLIEERDVIAHDIGQWPITEAATYFRPYQEATIHRLNLEAYYTFAYPVNIDRVCWNIAMLYTHHAVHISYFEWRMIEILLSPGAPLFFYSRNAVAILALIACIWLG